MFTKIAAYSTTASLSWLTATASFAWNALVPGTDTPLLTVTAVTGVIGVACMGRLIFLVSQDMQTETPTAIPTPQKERIET